VAKQGKDLWNEESQYENFLKYEQTLLEGMGKKELP
jgi:hypothetical protein